MRQYGIGYQGSKSQIAEKIITALPSGKRLVDLFGGGFAISHCALLSRKWDKVLYNDIDPLLAPLIQDAIAGKYNYHRFIPEWVSREEFHKRKNTDGYVKIAWSFGCRGKDYIYSAEIEEYKRYGHEWIIHNTPIPGFENIHCGLPCTPEYFAKRREYLNKTSKRYKGERFELQNLEWLERLQNLEQLERLQNLEYSSMDYRDYVYQDGDVVYCDIPYQNCGDSKNDDYTGDFNHGEFYQWAVSMPFPVYFSSYKLGGVVMECDKRITLSATDNSSIRREVLYCVDNNFVPPKKYMQGYLFKEMI